MAFERQTDRRDLDRGRIRARLDCGRCGRLLGRLSADPEHPEDGAFPRLWGPGNPSQAAQRVANRNRDGYSPRDGRGPTVEPVHPREYRHRYRCECGADWPFGSHRLGLAIIAKAKTTGRASVRLAAGVDV